MHTASIVKHTNGKTYHVYIDLHKIDYAFKTFQSAYDFIVDRCLDVGIFVCVFSKNSDMDWTWEAKVRQQREHDVDTII